MCEESNLEASLWTFVLLLFSVSVANFGLFLLSIKREYLGTFFDMRTGSRFVLDNYHAAKNDAMRFDIFTHHPSYYNAIVPELMSWLNENWGKWDEEKPEFFTAIAISGVPEDMLPVDVLNRLGKNKMERRASLKAKIAVEAKEKEERRGSRVVPNS